MTHQRLILSTTPRAFYGEHDELAVTFALQGSAFTGEICAYDDHRRLQAIRDALMGFPSHVGQEASFEYGIFDRLKVALQTSPAGRVQVEISLDKVGTSRDGRNDASYVESIKTTLLCEAAAIDEFCLSLAALVPGEHGEAILRGEALTA